MEALEGARWQTNEQLHLTLRFIGEVERPIANDLAAGLESIAWSPFDLAVEGVSHFERKGIPSAIWAKVSPTPELKMLRMKIERTCDRVGLGRETRRFEPHITIARLSRRSGPITPWLARHAGLGATWLVDGFTLFESNLLASGSHYEVAAHYPLRG
jgi:2'-5' RNA ligase